MFFDETYRCYSMAVAGRSDLEQGDKSASCPDLEHGISMSLLHAIDG